MRAAADDLTGGLLARRTTDKSDPLLAVMEHKWVIASELAAEDAQSEGVPSRAANAASVLDRLRAVSGTQLVPVYVLSLLNMAATEEEDGEGEVRPPLFDHRALLDVEDVRVCVRVCGCGGDGQG